jgi:hypothetical protein
LSICIDIKGISQTFLAAVYELASVESFGCNHQLLLYAVFVWIPELDDGKWGASTRIMDDILDNASNIAMAFGEVHWTKLGWAFAVFAVRFENPSTSFTLCANTATHFL